MTTSKPRVLIEDWLPIEELGIESRRENAAKSALPPLNFLHIWWARRPLVASAAVVLGGLLPAWSKELADAFPAARPVQSESHYRAWLLHLVGIWGDPVPARRAIDRAKAAGIRLPGNVYGYKQAFRNSVPREDVELLHAILIRTWGKLPEIADPTAGGGAIPWVASRLGLPVIANDLNGVAASVLHVGIKAPADHGPELVVAVRKWGKELISRVSRRLQEYYPISDGETVIAYIWANAVPCPRTGRIVPLLTDKWLRKTKGSEAAVTFVTEVDGRSLDIPRFEVIHGRDVDRNAASKPIVKGGKATSPYDNLTIDSGYIKKAAQEGRMSQLMYAVAIRTRDGVRTFRAPTQDDFAAIAAAEDFFDGHKGDWTANGILPTEDVPSGSKTREPLTFGIEKWTDFFTKRQALAHGVFVEEFLRLIPEVRESVGERANDVLAVLAFAESKALNRNARLSTWDLTGQRIRSVFDSHNYAFKWTFAEFEAAHQLYDWCLDNTLKAFEWIVQLLDESGRTTAADKALARMVTVTKGSAARLDLPSSSVAHICMDPPYYDNVQYAELADFFYVWEKRTLGRVFPDYFVDDLTDKENEAVANPERFAAMGRRKNELATLDYESKMTAIFGEARRVLRDDGVLSVMFTHKRAEAWDTLGMGLLQAGFTIETSWPVNTESENSIHQKNLNSAASTIMLVCRKREDRPDIGTVYLEDIEHEIREAAREAVTRFQHDGIDGVDLLLSTYGPTLSVISRYWPVYSSTPDEDGRERLLRPEEALDLAREEVVELRRARLVGKAAHVDDVTDFVLLAWDIFKAREFPFDTARLLALAVGGLDIDRLGQWKVLAKSSGTVRLLAPAERLRRSGDSALPGVRPEAETFEYIVDAVDTALYLLAEDGAPGAKQFLDKRSFLSDARFTAALRGLVNSIPRTTVKGEWVVPEAGLIDRMVTLWFPDIALPEIDELATQPELEQPTLFGD